MLSNKNKKTIMKTNKKIKNKIKSYHIFCYSLMAIFIGHWAFFFLYSNINSLLLSFQYFDLKTETFKFYGFSNLFANYGEFFGEIFNDPNVQSYLWNGFKVWIASIIWLPVPYLVSFAIYKKVPLSNAFTVIFFLPGILTGMFIAMSFKYFIEWGFPEFMTEVMGFQEFPKMLSDRRYAFGTLLFYQLYFGFASGLIAYVGIMRKIPDSLVDYSKLEGLSFLQEFIHLALPSLYNIIAVNSLTFLSGMFMSGLPAYEFYAENGYEYGVGTFSYYMFTSVIGGTRGRAELSYGFTTAANYVVGLISVISICIMKPIFEKFNPEFEV